MDRCGFEFGVIGLAGESDGAGPFDRLRVEDRGRKSGKEERGSGNGVLTTDCTEYTD